MDSTVAEKATKTSLRINEKKWGKPLMAAGFNVIPSIIIEKQRALGLDAVDMNIILHLSQYWWQAENLPHPSVETIAQALNVNKRTIQKRITRLHKAKLVERIQRRNTRNGSATNEYSFEGLIAAAEPYANEKVAEIAQAREDRQKRIIRKRAKKPTLVVDNDASSTK